jgi:hypothetical protein
MNQSFLNNLGVDACTDLHDYSQQTELQGRTYTFEFEWIERDKFWTLHIGDENGEPLACGIKLVTDWPLLRRDVGVLPRELMAIDSGDSNLRLVLLSDRD